MEKYLIKGRLEDVIRLITLLSLTESTFPLISSIDEKLRGKPLSVKKNQTWYNIGLEHPEFFRPNGEHTCIALLLRSCKPIVAHITINDYREPMLIDETQSLINKAMDLHEKSANRSQRWNFLWTAVVSAIALLLTNYFTLHSNNTDLKKSLHDIQKTIDSVNIKLKNNQTSKSVDHKNTNAQHWFGKKLAEGSD